ncbi:hypothetical protein LX64_04211 [Chitinophaga skermanii]|uniref:Uncharacterized protein n=1 Tax=Chitinophaga skermanii TaxID=331697 RepID=A0A327Q9E4_9BACT|nr:hypothetical protein [Chitinophaga skermanii]RAJ00504.1 hypothetical protein LX64_04211 [Chitinophaga skermanii]
MSNAMYLNPKQLHKVAVYPTANGFITLTKQRKPTNWNNECYEKIRSHRTEFGRAAQTASAIRLTFKEMIELAPDPSMYKRLSSTLLAIIKKDTQHIRGERTVEAGDIMGLADFQFNQAANFYRVCRSKPTIHMDRENGTAQVNMEAFNPQHELRLPNHTTHFTFVAAVHAINFDTMEAHTTYVKSAVLPVDQPLTEALQLHLDFTPNDPRHLFVSIGFEFIEILNDQAYNIVAGYKNPMCIARVYPKQAVNNVSKIPAEETTPEADLCVQTAPGIPTILEIENTSTQHTYMDIQNTATTASSSYPINNMAAFLKYMETKEEVKTPMEVHSTTQLETGKLPSTITFKAQPKKGNAFNKNIRIKSAIHSKQITRRVNTNASERNMRSSE